MYGQIGFLISDNNFCENLLSVLETIISSEIFEKNTGQEKASGPKLFLRYPTNR